MTRYNAIHKINDTWGSYEEKGKTPQWVNLKTGERYNIKNKETFTEFLKRLKETNTQKPLTVYWTQRTIIEPCGSMPAVMDSEESLRLFSCI